MWSDFEVESSTLLKDYKDLGMDSNSDFDTAEIAHERCKALKSEKQRLGCLYTLALAEHASFLEMHPSRATGPIVYGEQERSQKQQAAEKAYSKVHSQENSMHAMVIPQSDYRKFILIAITLLCNLQIVPFACNLDAIDRS
jgi:hypothetical protein